MISRIENTGDRVILVASLAVLLAALLLSSARISYDSSAIYFSDAKATALSGHVQFFTEDTFVASVFQSGILFSALIQLVGDQAARLFSWVCGMAIILLSLSLAERLAISRRGRLILLALFASSTAFLDLMGDGKVDLISTLPAVAAVHWMIVQQQARDRRPPLLFLIGILAGFAIIARPFNAFLLGIFTLLFYTVQAIEVEGVRARALRYWASSFFWVGLGVALPGIYHLFANWMILGDPFGFLSNVAKINPASGPWDNSPQQMLVLRLLYPVAASVRNSPQSLGNVSPLIIALAPAFLLREMRRGAQLGRETISLLVIAVITLAIWLVSVFTVVEIRYVFFLWILVYIPAAELIAALAGSGDKFFRAATLALITTLMGFFAIRTAFIAVDTHSPFDRLGNPQCTDFIPCEQLTLINQIAAPASRVLDLSAYRYYLRSDLFSCSTTHEEYRVLQALSYEEPEAFWEEVYRQGNQYIAYEKDYTIRHLQFGSIPSPETAPSWLRLTTLYGRPGDLEIAYRIEVDNPPVEILKSCSENQSGVWVLEPAK